MKKKIAVAALMMLTLSIFGGTVTCRPPSAVFAAAQEETQESPAAPMPAGILSEPVSGSTFELTPPSENETGKSDDALPLALVNHNMPDFYIWQISPEPYVSLSPLDELGRTGAGMACLGKETIPTEVRGQIGDIRPSGWHTMRYDDLIEDRYLYNRCHVLGYQLSSDNATPENLFTGTRFLNSESMLYFENMVMDYLEAQKDNHVIYRVSPVYHENDLVATGVQMEAFSVEDYGQGICFNVFLKNIQPGISIDYATGESERDPSYKSGAQVSPGEVYRELTKQLQAAQQADDVLALDAIPAEDNAEAADRSAVIEEQSAPETKALEQQTVSYILNTNTHKFHYPNCSSVNAMKEKNKKEFYGTRDEAIAGGYSPCGKCHP